jgi:hypothetical protein
MTKEINRKAIYIARDTVPGEFHRYYEVGNESPHPCVFFYLSDYLPPPSPPPHPSIDCFREERREKNKCDDFHLFSIELVTFSHELASKKR